MNTIPTNENGITASDEREIQKMIRKALREGYYTTKEEKERLKERLLTGLDTATKPLTMNEIAKTLLALEQTDLKRLEIFDKIDRLDRGDVTERTEAFTVIINEDRAPYVANDPTNPVQQAD